MNKSTIRAIDWRCALALAWAIGFGVLYARAMIEAKAPRAWRMIAAKPGAR